MTEYLPGYAPELNPVEYLWGYWKHHALPNFCLSTVSFSGGAADNCAAPDPKLTLYK
jgi:transposase